MDPSAERIKAFARPTSGVIWHRLSLRHAARRIEATDLLDATAVPMAVVSIETWRHWHG